MPAALATDIGERVAAALRNGTFRDLDILGGPGLTMAVLTAELAKHGVHVVITTIWRFVKGAGHTFGMNQRAVAPGRREGSDRPAKRTAPTRPGTIQIDETWLETNMIQGGVRSITVIAGLQSDGIVIVYRGTDQPGSVSGPRCSMCCSRPATSSSQTICRVTRSRPPGNRSKMPERN